MNRELLEYIKDVEKDLSNFELGCWYEEKSQLSPASSFYLRCAELTKDENLEYECLIRLYICYLRLSGRVSTCETILKQAISKSPQKPEAYFLLSQLNEGKNWIDSYMYSCLGLNTLNDAEPSPFIKAVGYESKYMMLFQKAVAAWWIGKSKESRNLFQEIKEKYRGKIREDYIHLLQRNLCSIGSGTEEESATRYIKNRDKLRFPFFDLESIEKNFSQACQDLFVLTVLNGKKQGTYLEIGSAHPFLNSNTALLELLGWSGVGVEIKKDLASDYAANRKNKVICGDALSVDYKSILEENFKDNVIDYLQLDVEPPKNTFDAMTSLPLDEYQFRVITYEHDYYVDISGQYRDKSRRYLRSMGYTLVVNDVATVEESSFEDWWVKQELVDEKTIEKIKSFANKKVNLVKEFFYE